jgi:hypothetical protein
MKYCRLLSEQTEPRKPESGEPIGRPEHNEGMPTRTTSKTYRRRAMAQSVRRRAYTAEVRVRFQVTPRENRVAHSGTVTGFSHSTSVSPVSTIPPMLHSHSFTYHPHYIMFLPQHFSFPLSVPFHQCSINIHSPTTNAI